MSDTENEKGLERITIYLNKGVGNSEKIGGDYDCRLDAMAAIKDHALNSGKEQIYGLFVNGLMTHFVKSNGYYLELSELPTNTQTRMSEGQAKDYGEHIIETIKTISEKNRGLCNT